MVFAHDALRLSQVTPGGGCFVAGTLVHTSQGLVPIEMIKIGDLVLSKPESGDGAAAYKRVVNTFRSKEKEVYEISYFGKKNGTVETLFATGNHPFWVKEIASLVLKAIDKQGEENPWAGKIGWNRLDHLEDGVELFELADGSTGYPMKSGPRPVLCTKEEGVGFVLSDRKSDDGQIVDFRCGGALLQAEMRFANEVDPEGRQEAFKATVFNIEVEEFYSYFVGEAGVWVKSREPARGHLSNPNDQAL